MNTVSHKHKKHQKVKIPEGYREILESLTYDVLLSQPIDVLRFCIENLNKRLTIKIENDDTASEHLTESDYDAPNYLKTEAHVILSNRRQGIAAERWDPEKETEIIKICYPKTDDQKQKLIKTIHQITLFRCLEEDDEFNDLIDSMFEKKVIVGENVITIGETGDNFYVIEEGIFEIFINVDGTMKKVGEYKNKGSFGELALMYNLPRAATVTATTKGILWAISRDTFRSIVLTKAYKKRQLFESLLESVDLLESLTTYERMNLADALYSKVVGEGEAVFLEGQVGEEMYFIEKGSVSIKINRENKIIELCQLRENQYFGELALITKAPRAASVFALEKTRLSVLEVDSFERILGPCETILKKKVEEYAQKRTQIYMLSGTNI